MPEDLPDRMPDRMSEDMPEDMPDRVPEDMPEHIEEEMPGRMPEDMPEDMPDRMPEDMPDKMPEDMSDSMPEDLPVTKRINVMVGITRSKIIVHACHMCWLSIGLHFLQSHFPHLDRGRSGGGPKWRRQDGSLYRETTWGSSLFSTSDE